MKKIILNGVEHAVKPFLEGFNIKVTPQSSNISLFAVNADKGELFVRFKNGGQFLYNPVDPETLHQALHAESIGKFVAREIVKKFGSTKINEEIFVVTETK